MDILLKMLWEMPLEIFLDKYLRAGVKSPTQSGAAHLPTCTIEILMEILLKILMEIL